MPIPWSVNTRSINKRGLRMSRWGSVLGELGSQRICQIFKARTGPDGSWNNRRICKRCAGESFANLISDDVDSAQVALGERNHGALHTEVIEDLQMLFALRHPAVICGNDKQCQID